MALKDRLRKAISLRSTPNSLANSPTSSLSINTTPQHTSPATPTPTPINPDVNSPLDGQTAVSLPPSPTLAPIQKTKTATTPSSSKNPRLLFAKLRSVKTFDSSSTNPHAGQTKEIKDSHPSLRNRKQPDPQHTAALHAWGMKFGAAKKRFSLDGISQFSGVSPGNSRNNSVDPKGLEKVLEKEAEKGEEVGVV